MAKYLKHLKQANKQSRVLTFQKRWPAELAEAAKAASYPAMFTMPTRCPVDGSVDDQLKAQKTGIAEFNKAVALLKAGQKAAAFGIQLGGARKPKRLYNRKALQSSIHSAHAISELSQLYQSAHREAGKALADRQRYWAEWFEYLGADAAADKDALDVIHRAFDDWQEHMLNRGLAPSSVERARNSVRAVLRWASSRYRIGWTIELQPLPSHQAPSKQHLNPEQQKQLLEAVVSHAGPTAAMVAVMMAGGLMASEIARLDVEVVSVTLASHKPYIVIGAGDSIVKKEARRRIVPIVWPTAVIDVIREHLPAAIERSAKGTDPSATVNKWMRARGIPTTGHGLRHTLSAAAQTAMVSPIALARIGGWSIAGAGISKQSLEYGRSVSDSELIDGLTEAAHEIWRHVLAMY